MTAPQEGQEDLGGRSDHGSQGSGWHREVLCEAIRFDILGSSPTNPCRGSHGERESRWWGFSYGQGEREGVHGRCGLEHCKEGRPARETQAPPVQADGESWWFLHTCAQPPVLGKARKRGEVKRSSPCHGSCGTIHFPPQWLLSQAQGRIQRSLVAQGGWTPSSDVPLCEGQV
jgi:hypothetical protein